MLIYTTLGQFGLVNGAWQRVEPEPPTEEDIAAILQSEKDDAELQEIDELMQQG